MKAAREAGTAPSVYDAYQVLEEQGAPMAGGDLEGSSEHGGASRLSRRDFTRMGALAGGVVWGAPKVTSIRFAQRLVGSGPPGTTTPPTDPPPTTTNPPNTTTTTTVPGETTTTIDTQGSTTTTVPGETTTTVPGETTTTVPGETTTTAPGGTTTTTNNVGPQTTTPGSTAGGTTTTPTVSPNSTVPGNDPGEGPFNGGSGSGGVLSFTGADSADLAVLGATAIVVGRALYVFGGRPREEETEVIDGVVPPIAP